MKVISSLNAVTCLLSLSTFVLAIPASESPVRRRAAGVRQLKHSHHHRHSGRPYPTATGTGTGVAAAPTGYYPTGNWTYPGASSSGSLLSGTAPSATASAFPTASYPTSSSVTAQYPTTSALLPPNITSTVASSTTAYTTPIEPTSSVANAEFLYGVNVGNWLILEKWMDPNFFTASGAPDAVDQWTFDSTPGVLSSLQQHWSTWFTEDDVKNLKGYGINALRIPIGFWAYDNSNTPYLQGADAYLEKAIGWARSQGMKVWVDCHGSPGSQNGQDHSGHKGAIEWQQNDNLNKSTAVLVTMAQKYGAEEYADVVVGLEIVNEPSANAPNNFDVSKQWAVDAYHAIRAVATNPNLVVVTHDSFRGPSNFIDIARSLGDANGAGTFGVDVHEYQLYTDNENTFTQPQHISEACGWANDLKSANAVMPLYVGEWSTLTNVCVAKDGTTTSGSVCTTDQCQCVSNVDPKDYFPWTKEQVRRYVEAQLDVYEVSTNGYFLWAWGGPGGWSFLDQINAGVIPNPVNDRASRLYPGQCGGL